MPDHSKKSPPPQTVEEVTAENVRTIGKLERAAQEEESFGHRLAVLINEACGSMIFLGINAVGFAVWISLNTFLLPEPWDPFPFSFLTLVVSLEAIFLSIFILIAGNRQARVAERRSHLDLQINLLAEQENTESMKLLHLIATKLGVGHEADDDYAVLAQATRPERLIAQINEIDDATDTTNGEDQSAPGAEAPPLS